jgi:cyclophilin family peptidyl-prolyl cis-trans isomerase
MLSYAEIYAEMRRLEATYPEFVELYSAQRDFGVASPGECSVLGLGLGCEQLFMRITDERTLPELDRPEVFFSGCLHGNERVGPTTTIELARFLLEAAAGAAGAAATAEDAEGITTAETRANRAYAEYADGDDDGLAWIRRLVSRRAVWIMPTANAWGYYHDKREELEVDPNRDFPYNVEDPKQCMVTTAARALNELWRRHAFQLAITFHAGQQSISSNWGAYNHPTPRDVPPDDVAQMQIIKAMSQYGGRFADGDRAPYGYGRLNDNVYPVNGGMEDWGYGASWEPGTLKHGCAPTTFGGYDIARTSAYDSASIRAFNILVETSDDKSPPDSAMGRRAGVLDAATAGGDGHIPRNMRLALLLTDIVEPYVTWANPLMQVAADLSAVAPLKVGGGGPVDPSGGREGGGLPAVPIVWRVGGAMHVDASEVVLVRWPAEKFEGLGCSCVVHGGGGMSSAGRSRRRSRGRRRRTTTGRATSVNKKLLTSPPSGVRGINWDELVPIPLLLTAKDVLDPPNGAGPAAAPWSGNTKKGEFSIHRVGVGSSSSEGAGMLGLVRRTMEADIAKNGAGASEYVLLARARVDEAWGKTLSKAWPASTRPQSHVARRRTDAEWDETTPDGCHRVKGRRWWYSETPICIQAPPRDPGGGGAGTPPPSPSVRMAPSSFVVTTELTSLEGGASGNVSILFNSEWAPLGVNRIRELVQANFFDDTGIFRVVPDFVVQWGLSGEPAVQQKWDAKVIRDDPAGVVSNVRGTVTFATGGPNTRTTQLFINLKDNARLDDMGFAPIGKVLGDGMDVIQRIYAGYRETPKQNLLSSLGDAYLTKNFPKMTRFRKWSVLFAQEGNSPQEGGGGAGGAGAGDSMPRCTAAILDALRIPSPKGCDPATGCDPAAGCDPSLSDPGASEGAWVYAVVIGAACVVVGYLIWRRVSGKKRLCPFDGGVQVKRSMAERYKLRMQMKQLRSGSRGGGGMGEGESESEGGSESGEEEDDDADFGLGPDALAVEEESPLV